MATPDLTGTTVLVTGANGFVGGRACATFAAAGADVRALVRREGTAPELDGVTEVVGGYEEAPLRAALEGVTHVVHCAAAAGPDLEAAAAINVHGTRLLGELTAEAGVTRLVHVSTTSVVAAGQRIIDEDVDLVDDEQTPYAVTKRQGEEVLAEVAANTGLDLVVLRPPTVQGWGATSTWGERMPKLYAAGEFPFPLDPRASMGWVHVDDFADALALATAADEVPSQTYVVGDTATWADYLDALASWYPDAPDPSELADEAPTAARMVSDRIRTELGWAPTRTLAEGLAEAAAHHP